MSLFSCYILLLQILWKAGSQSTYTFCCWACVMMQSIACVARTKRLFRFILVVSWPLFLPHRVAAWSTSKSAPHLTRKHWSTLHTNSAMKFQYVTGCLVIQRCSSWFLMTSIPRMMCELSLLPSTSKSSTSNTLLFISRYVFSFNPIASPILYAAHIRIRTYASV